MKKRILLKDNDFDVCVIIGSMQYVGNLENVLVRLEEL